jgi:hypothetical protein
MVFVPPRADILQQFFSPVGADALSSPDQRMSQKFGIRRGSLVSFNYAFWRNDPYPLVIVVDNELSGDKMSGINLHRLTFSSIRELIQRTYQMGFSYGSVSDNVSFRGAYRSYKRTGIRQVKVFDSKFLLRVISMVKSYDPAEVQIIRRQVQEQIRQQINPKANDIANLNQTDNTGE